MQVLSVGGLILLCLFIAVLIFVTGCIGDWIDRGRESVGARIIIRLKRKWHKRKRKITQH